MLSWSRNWKWIVAVIVIIALVAAGAVLYLYWPFQPAPPPIILSDKETLLPGETWDVFYENLTRYPVGNSLNLSYKANASIVYTVSYGLNVVSEGRCEESDLSVEFKIKSEFKVLFENDSDFEIEVSVEITVIDP